MNEQNESYIQIPYELNRDEDQWNMRSQALTFNSMNWPKDAPKNSFASLFIGWFTDELRAGTGGMLLSFIRSFILSIILLNRGGSHSSEEARSPFGEAISLFQVFRLWNLLVWNFASPLSLQSSYFMASFHVKKGEAQILIPRSGSRDRWRGELREWGDRGVDLPLGESFFSETRKRFGERRKGRNFR